MCIQLAFNVILTFQGWSGTIDLLRCEWYKTMKVLQLKISRQVQFQWTPNLHLKIMEMCLHMVDFLKGLKNEGRVFHHLHFFFNT